VVLCNVSPTTKSERSSQTLPRFEHLMTAMRLIVGDVVIWDPRADLGLCLVAILSNDGATPEDLRDWRPESRATVMSFARVTVQRTKRRVLTWNKDRTLNLLQDP
jgi:hypothetical protein